MRGYLIPTLKGLCQKGQKLQKASDFFRSSNVTSVTGSYSIPTQRCFRGV